jgi:hypothetical protein
VDRTGPPNSPDLNPYDYFLWGFLKEKIFLKKPQTVMELRALLIQACNEITEDMCRRVINNITVCVGEVFRCNGGHTEHLRFTENKSQCNGLSFCALVSSIVIELKMLLIDHILDHFVCHCVIENCYFKCRHLYRIYTMYYGGKKVCLGYM